jgi:hypothetical protein
VLIGRHGISAFAEVPKRAFTIFEYAFHQEQTGWNENGLTAITEWVHEIPSQSGDQMKQKPPIKTFKRR